jgi:hypothetical protein
MSKPGISNRESAEEEARERREHPPEHRQPPVEDVGGRSEDPADLSRDAAREGRGAASQDLQTSQKAGMRSLSQKEDDRRHPDSPAPSTRKSPARSGRKRRNAAGEYRLRESFPSAVDEKRLPESF